MFLSTGARIIRHHDNLDYAMIYGEGNYDDCDFLIITGSGDGEYYGDYWIPEYSHIECGYS